MERQALRVCHECMSSLRQSRRAGQIRSTSSLAPIWARRSFTSTYYTATGQAQQDRGSRHKTAPAQDFRSFSCATIRPSKAPRAASQDLNALHNRILELTTSATKPTDQVIPTEQRVLYVLEHLEAIAKSLDTGSGALSKRKGDSPDATATSALLGSVNARQYPAFISKAGLLDLISQKAEEIMRHPNVFITPAVLKTYVGIQTFLHQPSSFPDIFDLYATKPTPREASDSKNGVTYHPVSPDKTNSAVDAETANTALGSALDAHNLSLSLDIITTTFSVPAFKKSKILRQALVPGSILAAAPVVAYGLSLQFGVLQHTVDTSYATGVAFAGIMTYVGTVCSLGYITITTANDQMDRVTWAKGVPLWERWVREEERAALDRVAGKWGFQSWEKRGEEEGEDWEALKEFIGMRGMVLDRVELMEGME